MAVQHETRRPVRYAIEQYYAIRKTRGAAFAPDASEVAFISNTTGTGEVWRVPSTGGWPHQVTINGRNVHQVSWSPVSETLVFTADRDGDENFELFTVPKTGGLPVTLGNGKGAQAHFGDWSPGGAEFVYASNKRNPAFFDLYILDVDTGDERVLWQDDHVNMALSWSPDGRYVLVQQFEQNANQDLYVVEVPTGVVRLLTRHEGLVRHFGGVWEGDGAAFLFLSDNGRNFMGLARMDVVTGEWTYLEEPAADVVEVAQSQDGRWRAITVNWGGNFVPQVVDLSTGEQLPLPEFAQGVTSELTFSVSGDRLAFYHESARQCRDLWVVDLPPVGHTGTGHLGSRQVTFSNVGGIPAEDLVLPQCLSYRSFDGLEIPTFLYVPHGGRPDSSLPAIIWPHGGPDFQVTNNFYHWFQVFTGAGFVVLAPNFRGSTGYGKAFQSLNQKDWGGASFRDIMAGADYLIESGWADPKRLAVVGGSFGGFMSLTAATREPDRWAAIVDVFGPSNLFTFIENTPAWWKPYLYEMVGHPDRDQDQLTERSPVNYLDRVTAPLLVVQGAHDPRVTKKESDQVVERLRALGREVEYLVFDDEGHGFSRTANEIRAAKTIVEFLDRHLGR